MKYLILFISLFLQVQLATAQSTLQERLGYTKDTRLVIIHADDLGLSYSENKASTLAIEKGSVNSASIMVPCPWFPEIADYARTHPGADMGIHLTLTSEWKYYKFGPVSPKEKVPGLVNRRGFLYESVDSVVRHATATEIETEIRAQIERAKQFGIDITHLDSHMGTLFATPEFLTVLVRLGREYKLPVMLSKQMSGVIPPGLLTSSDVMLDMIYMAYPDDYKRGMEKFYTGVFRSLKPGVNIILLHAAYDDREMQGITIDHPDYGAEWRQADLDFFTSEKCKKTLAENKIQLITWREIRDKLLR